MSEDTQESPEIAAEVSVPNNPAFVRVHSMVRRRETRRHRQMANKTHRFKQYIMGGTRRVIRGRYVEISWADLLKHRAELLDRWQKGMVEVRLRSGQVVDLRSLEAGPAHITPPLPNFLPDSAARDLPAGRPLEQLPGGVSPQDPAADEIAAELASEKNAEAAKKGIDPEPEENAGTGEAALEDLLQETAQEAAAFDETAPAVAPPATEEYVFNGTAAGFKSGDLTLGGPVEGASETPPTEEQAPPVQQARGGKPGKKGHR